MKDGYKVVKRIGDRLISCFAPHMGAREYGIGVTTTPRENSGPLAVFDKIEDAVDFMRNNLGEWLVLYKCKYVPASSDIKQLWCKDPVAWDFARIVRRASKSLPTGTVLASEVVLEEEVTT